VRTHELSRTEKELGARTTELVERENGRKPRENEKTV